MTSRFTRSLTGYWRPSRVSCSRLSDSFCTIACANLPSFLLARAEDRRKEGVRLVMIWGVFGMVLAGAVTWTISGFLYGVGPNDIATFIAIPVLLSVVALFAARIPARRASRVDPVGALRNE